MVGLGPIRAVASDRADAVIVRSAGVTRVVVDQDALAGQLRQIDSCTTAAATIQAAGTTLMESYREHAMEARGHTSGGADLAEGGRTKGVSEGCDETRHAPQWCCAN